MPKLRQTCTECSIRRQKCDRGQPCGRCVKRGVADRCTLQWREKKPASPRASLPRASTPRHGSATDTTEAPSHSPALARDREVRRESDGDMTFSFLRDSQLSFMSIQGQLDMLQLLLPNVACLNDLVCFHEKYILWCVSLPTRATITAGIGD